MALAALDRDPRRRCPMLASADLLACELAERAQTARQASLRADTALEAWLAQPAYQRRDTGTTVRLADLAASLATAAAKTALMRWTWRTVVWRDGVGVAVEVGLA